MGAVSGGQTYGGGRKGAEPQTGQKEAAREHEGACGAGQRGQEARCQTQVERCGGYAQTWTQRGQRQGAEEEHAGT